MAEKSVKTRVQTKRGTSADWALATGFKPLEGEYIFYTDLNKAKVGRKDADGNLMLLKDLPFLDAHDADTLDGHHAAEFVLKTEPIPVESVQADWNVTETDSKAFIKNKPNVVLEGDARLTDARTPVAHNQAATTITEDASHRFVTDIEKAAWNAKSTFSGNYNDLTNKPAIPTIPSALPADGGNADTVDGKHASEFVLKAEAAPADAEKNVQSDWNETNTSSDAYIKNKPNVIVEGDLRLTDARTPTTHTQAATTITEDATHRFVTDTEKSAWNAKSNFSGSYNDLANKPTIPTVNNGTLIIQKNGTAVQTFTANQSSNVIANITVPTKTSDLTNDSGFKTTDNNTTYDLAAAKSKTNGNVTIDLTAGGSGSGTDSVAIKGSGATTVTTDANGVITISSTDTNTNDGNDNQTVKTGNVTFGVNDVVEFVAGSNVSISGDAANKKITISSTDTNTETTIAVSDKVNTDTTDLVYAITNLVEGGTKGHVITPTYTGLPTKTYVDKMVTGTVEYLGTVSGTAELSTTAGKGDFYRVSTQFTFGSETAHVGDILLAAKDNPAQNTTDWDLIHTEVDSNTWVENKVNAAGYVTAPGTSTANKVWKTDGSGNPGWRDDSNTDTKVTSVDNHYTPAADSTKELSVDANSTTSASWGTTDLVTGVNIQRDAKGHVTGVTVDSVQMPANPNSETTLTITDKAYTDTSSLVYAVTNITEGGTKGHTITPAYTGLPTKAYVDNKVTTLISSGTADPSASTTSQYYFKYN